MSKPTLIQALHLSDFEIYDPLIFATIPTLRVMHIDDEMDLTVQDLELLPVYLKINANCLYNERDEINLELVEALKSRGNFELDFKFCLMCPSWKIENLYLMYIFKIGLFDVSSVCSTTNRHELVKFLIDTKPANVQLKGGMIQNISYEDVADLVRNNVAVTYVDTSNLDDTDLFARPFP